MTRSRDERQRRQDGGDDGDVGRTRRAVLRRPRIRSHRSAAVPREGHPRAVEALKLLLDAGADPNAKTADGSTLLHQSVTVRRVDAIRALVAKGAKLDGVNKDNMTPLLLAEKPDPPLTAAQMQQDPGVYKPRRDKREDVIATLRELMHLGADDPAPQPPPLPEKKDEKKKEEPKVDVGQ